MLMLLKRNQEFRQINCAARQLTALLIGRYGGERRTGAPRGACCVYAPLACRQLQNATVV